MNPKTKIFINGKLIRPRKYERQSNGEFVPKRKLDWKLVPIAIAVMGIPYFALSYSEPVTVHFAHAETVVDRTPEKIAKLKAGVIDTLLKCESAGHSEDAAIIKYDNNKAGTLTGKNVFSLGQLQFKVSTVQAFVKQRTGEVISQKEAVLIALDTERARELATWAIFEKNAVGHWYNCSVKHNLAAKVAMIKELE